MARNTKKSVVRSEAKSSPAPRAKAKSSVPWKGLGIGLAFVVALGLVGSQIVAVGRKKAAQNIQFVRQGVMVAKGVSDGHCWGARGMSVGPDGSWYHLDGDASKWRLQKFGADMIFKGKYVPSVAQGMLQDPVALADGHDGSVYVMEKGGKILVLDSDLKFLRVLPSPAKRASSLAVNKAGDVYVVANDSQKIFVVGANGAMKGEFGSPDGKGAVTSPVAVVLDKDDNIYVLEGLGEKTRIKAYSPDGAFKRAFFIDLKITLYTAIGVDAQRRLYFSDLSQEAGVRIYKDDGTYVGAAKSSEDGQMFSAQGYLAVSRYDSMVFINYTSAVGRFIYQSQPRAAE